MTSKPVTYSNQKGFTLIEIAIVIIIAGILLAFLGDALTNYLKNNRIQTTEYRLEQIKESLVQYLSINRKYPCPANIELAADDANFGRAHAVTCENGTPVGTGTVEAGPVRIGAVPIRTLNLPDEFAGDAWGNKYTYAVTEALTNPADYSPDGGGITIIDGANNEIVGPGAGTPNPAHFTIVSHGEEGAGGTALNSNDGAVPCPANTVQEFENCDNDRTFRITLVQNDAGDAYFDDYAIYQGQTALVETIPTGLVAPFNLDVCPPGWAEFAAARGRVIMGAIPAPGPFTRNHRELQTEINIAGHSHNATMNPVLATINMDIQGVIAATIPITGGTDIAHNFAKDDATALVSDSGIPPYHALIYCEKLSNP